MGVTSFIGPLMGLAGSAMGGKGGGPNVTGGLSPQQAALAEYEGMQRKIGDAAKFSSGMGHSTMRTFADAASDINTAKSFAGMSDTTAQQQNNLQQIAQQAGFGNIGSAGGSTPSADTTAPNTNPDVSTG
jgi:hypothetical protein